MAHKKRDQIIKKLKKKNIILNIQYPNPIHKMTAYKKSAKYKNNNLNFTEKFSKKIFSLPIYPSLELYKIKKIINELGKIIGERK